MTQLVVSFSQLQSAIDHMREFERDVAEVLEDVDQTMVALRATWHGEASDAQARSQQQWEDGAEQMKEALSQLQKIAEMARRNYADAVEKNGRMWA
ncbi:WXG100 family type VII secretion target [Mycolicibacterium litorale]|uniref:ESAT-6-like protein n=1 Tax=Mycolicibacterium litorale TaxID=758802 RepID=A0AAD1IKN8_9MYCO|nr:WXG100 family type VII secretion target [Mycolicibacterium litorale]MCV7416005.1 WXG100 family type VII secretion target [Mycolicibacterium litorale]TDY09259.1 WXG100 family type VII secretion target [Mycolicibacterium litorale]BBY17199.1 ESAT-6-like protein [Mycolicibacterium litorale]